ARNGGVKAPLRREAWLPRYETDQGVGSRRDFRPNDKPSAFWIQDFVENELLAKLCPITRVALHVVDGGAGGSSGGGDGGGGGVGPPSISILPFRNGGGGIGDGRGNIHIAGGTCDIPNLTGQGGGGGGGGVGPHSISILSLRSGGGGIGALERTEGMEG
nr:hypothetical protein [Tanacetum cinerariifolium]